MKEEIINDLNTKPQDIIHSMSNAALSSIPYVGSFISEIFNQILVSPVEKRKEKWLVNIAESIDELNNKVDGFSIEKLADNDLFISILNRASQLAISNHQQEKLESFHNAVINTAMAITIDENEQMMFLNLVDSMTPWHIKILYYFKNPKNRFIESGKTSPRYMMGSPIDPLTEYYTDLKDRKELINLIIKDLYINGIMNTENLNATMTEEGIYAPRLTPYGERFLKYISKNQ